MLNNIINFCVTNIKPLWFKLLYYNNIFGLSELTNNTELINTVYYKNNKRYTKTVHICTLFVIYNKIKEIFYLFSVYQFYKMLSDNIISCKSGKQTNKNTIAYNFNQRSKLIKRY